MGNNKSGDISNASKGVVPHHKVLVVGKTGSGKSTAINMFANLINQKSYKDPRMIAITQRVVVGENNFLLECNMPQFMKKQSDQHVSNTYESQTSEVFIYELQGKDYSISLIDTPGLGDTKGIAADEDNIKKVVAKIQQLSKITCILYIHRQTDIRECSFLKYYINQLKDLLPMEYKDNIVIGFTSAQNTFKIEAMSVLQKSGIPVDKYVCFENDCLMHPDQFPKGNEQKRYQVISEIFWESNVEQFNRFIQMIIPMIPQDTSILLNQYCKKQTIIQLLFQKQHKIDEFQQKKSLQFEVLKNIVKTKFTLLNSPQSSVKLTWQTMKKTRKIKKYIDVELDNKVTFCYDCCNICHNPCYLEEIFCKGDVKIKNCQAFGCGSLDKCNNCSHAPEYHGHTMKIQQTCNEDIEIDYEKIKKSQSQAINEIAFRNEINTAISQLTTKQENMEKQIKQKDEEIKKETLFIAVLFKYVKDQNMNFNNQIIIEYIQTQIDNTNKDTQLAQDEKQKKQDTLKAQLEYYLMIQQQFSNSNQFNFAQISKQQLELMECEIKQIIDNEIGIVKKRDFS